MIVFVLGPGRCGTSTMARLLHTEMGVSMGERLRPANEYNPEGFYEDLDFKEPNEALLSNRMGLKQWQGQISDVLERRRGRWGLKDPRLCYLLGFYRELLDEPPLLVRCRRSLHHVAASMMRCYGWPIAEALTEAARREALLDVQAAGCEEISFDEQRKDEEVAEWLRLNLFG